jgi:sphingomyelin phosphodiesterase 2
MTGNTRYLLSYFNVCYLFHYQIVMELTALTLNCWGIAGVSKDRKSRINAIGNHLLLGHYDFVFLQEVWVEDDFQTIVNKVGNIFPYSHYFHSGVIGGGICILSKAKIVDVLFHAWSLNGYIHKIQHGDWFGGKGVGLCTVYYHGMKINLYVTHVSISLISVYYV